MFRGNWSGRNVNEKRLTLQALENDRKVREKLVINTKFAAPLADSITVVFQILTLTVLVRNQVGQQRETQAQPRFRLNLDRVTKKNGNTSTAMHAFSCARNGCCYTGLALTLKN